MKYIGIIAAMEEEMNAIKKLMNEIKEIDIKNLKFIEGKIKKQDCVLVQCGVGKVNAARTTQLMIDNYEIEEIINVGSAGGLSDKLNVGDIVIGNKIVQYDFDITAFGHKKGYISGVGEYVECDPNLISKIVNIVTETGGNYKVEQGIIATGDRFCNSVELKQTIIKEFNAIAVEMEGGAIAQVAFLNNVPVVIIRSISDSPNGNNEMDFEKYLELASSRCAEIIKKFVEYSC